MNGDADVINI